MDIINQKEYLKKYLAIGKAPGEKKKKKKSKGVSDRVKIIDDDAEATLSNNIIIEDPFQANEDAPQIVAIIDERPPSLRVDEKTKNPLWQPIGASSSSGNLSEQKQMITGFKIAPKSNDKSFVLPDKSPPRRRKIVDDRSPPRRSKNTEHSPSKKRNENDDALARSHKVGNCSPLRNKYALDDGSPSVKSRYDNSPPGRSQSSDSSPQRRIKSEDVSPPRKSRSNDSSPPTKSQNDDSSPPRRSKSDDISPPRKLRRDNSPPSRSSQGRSRNDISPPRKSRSVHEGDISPSRRSQKASDSTPPRRNKRKEHHRTPDNSPPRKHGKNKMDHKPSNDGKRSPKMEKTLDGKTAGLQSAQQLVEETNEFRTREDQQFKNLSQTVSGENAETIFRDRKSGKIRNLAEEEEQQRKKREEEEKNKEKYTRWGRGVVQVENTEQRVQDELYEMSKPLARYADDEDLEKYLKQQEREGDPMLAYIRKKKRKQASKTGVVTKPEFEGQFMPNRFGIRPGHRWDGVDRSNGYEKRWFEVQNARMAQQEESYKWSTEDM